MGVQRLVHQLSRVPLVFDILRWMLEGGHHTQKSILKKELFPLSGKILDLGCGTGILANLFPKDLYVGIDENSDYISEAKKKNPFHEFQVMKGQNLTWEENTFQIVLVSGVLHHLNDQEAKVILKEISRVLDKNSGYLFLWEDIPIRKSFNLIGKLVQYYDEGKFIREESEYRFLLADLFKIMKSYFTVSGVCEYGVMMARPLPEGFVCETKLG